MFDMWWIVLQYNCMKFTAKSVSGEKILKIDQHLAKLQPKL